MKILSIWKLLRTTRRTRIRSPFVHHTPLTYQTRNILPPVHLSENTKHREYFPGCFHPFIGITYYRIRAHRTPGIVLLRFVMLWLLCYLLCSLSVTSFRQTPRLPATPSSTTVLVTRPSCQSNQASPPPLITRYRLFSSILLALE